MNYKGDVLFMETLRNAKKEIMTSRERVQEAFKRQKSDRVPINYSANASIDARLKKYFSLDAADNFGLINALGIDFLNASPAYIGPKLHPEVQDRMIDKLWGTRCRWVEHQSGGYWDYCDFPFKDADLQLAETWPMPDPNNFDYKSFSKYCNKYKDFALHYGDAGLGDIMNSMGMLCGTERIYMAMADEDEALMRLIDRKIDVSLEIMRRAIEAAEGNITFVWLGEDLGTQRGPLISLTSFREILRPRHQKFIDVAKQYGLPVMIHSCGSSSWAFDDLVEMGINVVDTLQPEAFNMEPSFLKSRYGNKLAFHGCISTAEPLSHGTEKEVIENVKSTLKIMMKDGGYCLAPTHAIQDNSRTENVVAMYRTAHKYGWYK